MKYSKAVDLIRSSTCTYAFTGAGISVESGIPPFRGPGGLWQEYDPGILDLANYLKNPSESWPAVKRLFFDFFGKAQPNHAHISLTKLEAAGLLKGIITQNIDHLHQEAGSLNVIEFHGNCNRLVCTSCEEHFKRNLYHFTHIPPSCPTCKGLLKPDFVFFGEDIPHEAYQLSVEAAREADLFIIIGTAGEVYPASYIPELAKNNGVKIIEINTDLSGFSHTITDLFIQEKASVGLSKICEKLGI